MAKKSLKPSPYLYPTPVLLISSRGKTGKPNIATISRAGLLCSESSSLIGRLDTAGEAHPPACQRGLGVCSEYHLAEVAEGDRLLRFGVVKGC